MGKVESIGGEKRQANLRGLAKYIVTRRGIVRDEKRQCGSVKFNFNARGEDINTEAYSVAVKSGMANF